MTRLAVRARGLLSSVRLFKPIHFVGATMTFCLCCFGLAAVAWVGEGHDGLAFAAVGVNTAYSLDETEGSVFDFTEPDGFSRTEPSRSYKGQLRAHDITPTYGGTNLLPPSILAEGDNTELIPVEYTTEAMHPEKPEELNMQESETAAVVTPPLRGIKTFILGALVLAFMLFVLASPDDPDLEENSFNSFHQALGENVLDALSELDDMMSERMPHIPLLAMSFLLSLGTALMFSGMVQLGITLANRYWVKGTRATSRMLPLILTPLALVVVMGILMTLTLDDYSDDFDQDERSLSSSEKYGMAVKLLAGLLAVTIAGEAIQTWRNRHRASARNAAAHSDEHGFNETSRIYYGYPFGGPGDEPNQQKN